MHLRRTCQAKLLDRACVRYVLIVKYFCLTEIMFVLSCRYVLFNDKSKYIKVMNTTFLQLNNAVNNGFIHVQNVT